MRKLVEPVLVGVLIVAIGGCLAFYILLQPEIPQAPPKISKPVLGGDGEEGVWIDDPTTAVTSARYPELGDEPVFEPLIPKPTPTPTPPPPPRPFPKLEAIIKGWKLVGLETDTIEIQKGTEIFSYSMAEVKEIELGNTVVKILLVDIDSDNFSAKFRAPAHDKEEEQGIDAWTQEAELSF